MGIPDHLTCLLRNLVCRSGSNSWTWIWNNRLVLNWERSMSRLCQVYILSPCFSSIQFSCSFVFNSLQPHGLQHARLPCPSPDPEAYSNSSHWVGDAVQPSHPLLSHSPLTFNLSQHQGLFKWLISWHQMARLSVFQFHHQSFQWIFRTDFL